MTNEKLRREISKSGLYQWQVADCMGISDITFCRMLRHELTGEQRQRVLDAIERAITKREGNE